MNGSRGTSRLLQCRLHGLSLDQARINKSGRLGIDEGRPGMPAEIRQALEAATPRAVAKLIELLDDEDPRVALVACREVLDRSLGKASQAVMVDATMETQHLEAYGEQVRIAVLRCLEAKHARIDAGLDHDD